MKIALVAAQESATTEVTTSYIHIPSVVIPRNASIPNETTQSLIVRGEDSGYATYDELDDRQAFKNAILDADAIIIASATHNRQLPGYLKVVMDQIGGPALDVAAAWKRKGAGDTDFDDRVLKPRVLAFIATGGSRTVDQYSQVLPTLYPQFHSLHAKVVDQYVAKGFLASGAVLASPSVVERVGQLGRNVASQLGKSFEDARYLGPEEEGSCQYCHLSALELFHTADNAVGCVTCGAKGRLVVKEDGRILPEWEEDSEWSCETKKGKKKYDEDVAAYIAEERASLDGIEEEREKWRRVEIEEEALPSHAAGHGLQDG